MNRLLRCAGNKIGRAKAGQSGSSGSQKTSLHLALDSQPQQRASLSRPQFFMTQVQFSDNTCTMKRIGTLHTAENMFNVHNDNRSYLQFTPGNGYG